MRPSGPSRGFSLLELVVVMAILIVLSGIVVVLLPNLLFDAHASNGATTTAELNKALQTYQTARRKLPDYFDAMVHSDGTPPAEMMFVKTDGTVNANSGMTVKALSANEAASLTAAGVTKLYPYSLSSSASFHPTFNCEDTAVDVAQGVNVCALTPAEAVAKFGPGIDTSGSFTYVVLGVGEGCTLVGDPNCGISEAPVRGTPKADMGPDKKYGRFSIVLKVDNTSTKSSAQFVGATCIGGESGSGTTEHFIAKYYDNHK